MPETIQRWGERPYHSLEYELMRRYGRKMYKLSLNANMTCPNRDGTLGSRGCIFCSNGGSGEFAADPALSITDQIREQIRLRQNRRQRGGKEPPSSARTEGAARAEGFAGAEGAARAEGFAGAEGAARAEGAAGTEKYIAYFQAFTNTYAPAAYLERIFTEAIMHPDVAVLSIATRPDCLPPDVLALLGRLNKIKPVWTELGLQTIHPQTAAFIRRGYDLPCFAQAVSSLRNLGIDVIVHTILGLPGETRQMVLETMSYLSHLPIQGIKLQLLHILEGTDLAALYRQHPFHILTADEYASLTVDCLEHLAPSITIHRLTGDGPKDLLIAPLWSADKHAVLNRIHHELKIRHTWQGRRANE